MVLEVRINSVRFRDQFSNKILDAVLMNNAFMTKIVTWLLL
jgi:hypothetical protein